jgi:anti-anti-sigma factor
MDFRLETIEGERGRVTLRPFGEIDVTSAGQLVDAVVNRAQPVTECAIDLSGVTFMDSSGIKAIVVCRDSLHRRAAAIHIVGAHDGVAKLLHLTGIDYLLERDEAVVSAISN